MKVLNWIVVIFFCAGLLSSAVANASMFCCYMHQDEQVGMEFQQDNMDDKSCHDNENDNNNHNTLCDGCHCQHGVQAGLMLPVMTAADIETTAAYRALAAIHYTNNTDGIFQPPKANA